MVIRVVNILLRKVSLIILKTLGIAMILTKTQKKLHNALQISFFHKRILFHEATGLTIRTSG